MPEDTGRTGTPWVDEGRPKSRADWRIPNKGELELPEKHPADPLKDAPTRLMSHRGGLASSRTEHF